MTDTDIPKTDSLPGDEFSESIEQAKNKFTKKPKTASTEPETDANQAGKQVVDEPDMDFPSTDMPAMESGQKSVSIDLSPDMIADIIVPGFKIIATRAGNHWEISRDEAMTISVPLKAVLDKYNVRATPESALALALGTILIPRGYVSVMEYLDKKDAGKKKIIESVEGIQ